MMRNREKIWRKYETPETWMAYDIEKKRYNTLLKLAKEETIKCKVPECKNDTKKLYKLVANITETKKDNPLPEATSDKELVEKFADFFYNKIANIRKNLDVLDTYEPAKRETPYLSEFQLVTPAVVRKILASMANRSCEKFLKAGLDYILEEITDLINFSLQFRQFPRKWKTSIIWPMIKKMNLLNLDLRFKQFRPINNETFSQSS